MKPFLILQLRPNNQASDGEFRAILKHGHLREDEVVRIRMEEAGIPPQNLNDYSAVIVGGGPSNVSDPEEIKEKMQKRFETDLSALLDEIVARDFPYLGACYGLGALVSHQKGVVSKERYSEPVGAVTVTLSEAGTQDTLLSGLPESFRAFVGHKESCQVLPANAVLLASSETCPVQMIRIGANVYGTQFHPELDVEGICTRVDVYRHAGYFPPEDGEKIKDAARTETVTVPTEILKRFVERYRAS